MFDRHLVLPVARGDPSAERQAPISSVLAPVFEPLLTVHLSPRFYRRCDFSLIDRLGNEYPNTSFYSSNRRNKFSFFR